MLRSKTTQDAPDCPNSSIAPERPRTRSASARHEAKPKRVQQTAVASCYAPGNTPGNGSHFHTRFCATIGNTGSAKRRALRPFRPFSVERGYGFFSRGVSAFYVAVAQVQIQFTTPVIPPQKPRSCAAADARRRTRGFPRCPAFAIPGRKPASGRQ